VGVSLALKAEGLPGISPRARVVLNAMALHALDTPSRNNPAAVYWAGWPLLAGALGYLAYDGTSEEAVRRAVKELKDAGYVKVEGHGYGYRTAYRLVL
jgi:hypothetical protein